MIATASTTTTPITIPNFESVDMIQVLRSEAILADPFSKLYFNDNEALRRRQRQVASVGRRLAK
jgi:hypothetical protein